jgi:hypothetical protein
MRIMFGKTIAPRDQAFANERVLHPALLLTAKAGSKLLLPLTDPILSGDCNLLEAGRCHKESLLTVFDA